MNRIIAINPEVADVNIWPHGDGGECAASGLFQGCGGIRGYSISSLGAMAQGVSRRYRMSQGLIRESGCDERTEKEMEKQVLLKKGCASHVPNYSTQDG